MPPLTPAAEALLHKDVRASTRSQYDARINVFRLYCEEVGADPATCHVNTVLNFLTGLWQEKKLSYQSICGYRSAIAKQHVGLGDVPLGKFTEVRRLVRACFLERPPLPKYGDIWDVDRVLTYLETLHPALTLSAMDLAMKTASLTFILTLSRSLHVSFVLTSFPPRASSVALLRPDYQEVDGHIIFKLDGLEKTARPGAVRGEIRCPSGSEHPPLSLTDYLAEYSRRTASDRDYYRAAEGCLPNRLFIANTKPFQPVTPSTLARWLLTAMARAGVDTTSYKAHSVRSAASSGMLRRGLSLAQVLERANWSPTSRTFAVFYNRA